MNISASKTTLSGENKTRGLGNFFPDETRQCTKTGDVVTRSVTKQYQPRGYLFRLELQKTPAKHDCCNS